jgi:hypothetical protein
LSHQQLNLFTNNTIANTHNIKAEMLVMSADALLEWKSQILSYQQQVRQSKPPQ